MTHLLIIEANTPDMPPATAGFVEAFARLDQTVTIAQHAPYTDPLSVDHLAGVDGVVFTGSGVAWSTDAAEAKPQRDAMELVFQHGLPSWGSCNGMQLATVVLGGVVGASPKGIEVGVAQNLARADTDHPMFAGRAATWETPCIHRDETQRLPIGAVLSATNDHSPVQAFAYEQNGVDFWGTQYHPELSTTRIADYMRNRDSIFQDHADMIADLDIAETNEQAAARLGTTPDMLAFDTRTLELANWLAHVKDRKTT